MDNRRFFRRISKELKDIEKNPLQNVSIGLKDQEDLYTWEAYIFGAEGTPYHHGIFKVSIILPLEYPFKPPSVKFLTRIFHSNINNSGEICLDLLKHNWSAVHTLQNVMMSLVLLLDDHNPEDPYNIFAANMYKTNPDQYLDQCRIHTLRYATSDYDEDSVHNLLEDPDLQFTNGYNVVRIGGSPIAPALDYTAFTVPQPRPPPINDIVPQIPSQITWRRIPRSMNSDTDSD
jgi:ubiquitin-conjugating enzyme E2 D/E